MTSINVEVLHQGRVLHTIDHTGQSFVEAPTNGSNLNYEIRLSNTTGRRLLCVLSVDGINAVDGKDAGFTGQGYVLDAFESFVVKGWYRDGKEAAAFTFTPAKGGSYADQTGRGTKNVGVIGVAVFDEKVPRRVEPPLTRIIERIVERRVPYDPWYPWPRVMPNTPSWWESDQKITCTYSATEEPASASAASATSSNTKSARPGFLRSRSAASYSADDTPRTLGLEGDLASPTRGFTGLAQDLGTGYGARVEMRTTTTSFDRKKRPTDVIQIRYASREVLDSWGVPASRPVPPPAPSAFPQDVGVPAPAGWRG